MSSNLPVHEFDLWERTLKAPTRNPDYNGYTEVDDDFIQELMEACSIMRTYFHSYTRPELGLDYYGITLIPNESLSMFYEIVTQSHAFHRSDELSDLASLIIRAEREGKDLVHFGI